MFPHSFQARRTLLPSETAEILPAVLYNGLRSPKLNLPFHRLKGPLGYYEGRAPYFGKSNKFHTDSFPADSSFLPTDTQLLFANITPN